MKARQLLAAILREGWVISRQEGSHRVLVRDGKRVVFSFHDRTEVPPRIVARYARECGIERKGR